MLHPKIFNINQKSDFEVHSKMLVKKNKIKRKQYYLENG